MRGGGLCWGMRAHGRVGGVVTSARLQETVRPTLLPGLGPSAPRELCTPSSVACDSQTISKNENVSRRTSHERTRLLGGRGRRRTPRTYGEDVVIDGFWLPGWVAEGNCTIHTRWYGELEAQSSTSPPHPGGTVGNWRAGSAQPPSVFSCKTEARILAWAKGTL